MEELITAVDLDELDAIIDKKLLELSDFVSPDILKFLLETPLEPPPTEPHPIEPPPTERLSTEPASTEPRPNVRFGKALSERQLQDAVANRVPANTKKSTSWGYTVWMEWCNARDIKETIVEMGENRINELMAHFVQEVRRKDGNEYPPGSLTSIVAAVQRYLRENGRPEVSFLDDKNPTYDLLRKSLDAKLKQLTRKGVGCHKKQAQPITPEMEQVLWDEGIFSRKTGEGLTNAVYWYSSKMFGLRATDEHRQLDVSQFTIGTDQTGKYLRFLGRGCKNWQGGLHQQKIDPKDLKIYAKPELGERCAVSIFEFYLGLIPANGPFYRRPLVGSPPRYSIQVIGVNKLAHIVKNFCEKAGFQGYFTNHSGKVTCATELFKQNIDEQLIMKQTGHRSQDAVRRYKRPSVQHQLQVSDILQPPAAKKSSTSENLILCEKENTPSSMSSRSTTCAPSTSCSTPVFHFSVQGNAKQNIYVCYKQ